MLLSCWHVLRLLSLHAAALDVFSPSIEAASCLPASDCLHVLETALVMPAQTCRTLLKFLQWQHQQFSYQVVSEVLHVALKDVEFSHCTAVCVAVPFSLPCDLLFLAGLYRSSSVRVTCMCLQLCIVVQLVVELEMMRRACSCSDGRSICVKVSDNGESQTDKWLLSW